MATVPLALIEPVVGDKGSVCPPLNLPRERAATSGWRHLLFGTGPFFYRLLRFAQRNRG